MSTRQTIRARAVQGLDFLGVAVDDDLNASGAPDREITGSDARAQVLVIAAREDLEIARQARAVMQRLS